MQTQYMMIITIFNVLFLHYASWARYAVTRHILNQHGFKISRYSGVSSFHLLPCDPCDSASLTAASARAR